MGEAIKLKNPLINKPLDLNEWAYKSIKMRILNNELAPGSQLNIEIISKELNISRTPIREALLRLKQSGLVIALPCVGFFVCGITTKDFEDIFELRHLIETYAIEKLAPKITDEELEHLIGISDRCELMAQQGNLKEYNHCDIILHGFITDSLGNKRMRDIYENVYDLLYRMRMYALKSTDNINQSIIEHKKVIESLQKRDAARARLAMEEHLENIKTRLRLVVKFQDEPITR